MEIKNSIEQHVVNVSNGKVIRKRKKPIIPIFFLMIGIVLCFQFYNFSEQYGDMIGNAVLFLGSSFCLYGLFASFNKQYIYLSLDGQKVQKYSFGFEFQDYSRIKTLYDMEQFDALRQFPQSDSPGVIIDIMGCKDGDFYVSQMTKYVPHHYVVENQGRLHEGDSIQNIRQFLNSKR